jgi:hypothetical protein
LLQISFVFEKIWKKFTCDHEARPGLTLKTPRPRSRTKRILCDHLPALGGYRASLLGAVDPARLAARQAIAHQFSARALQHKIGLATGNDRTEWAFCGFVGLTAGVSTLALISIPADHQTIVDAKMACADRHWNLYGTR